MKESGLNLSRKSRAESSPFPPLSGEQVDEVLYMLYKNLCRKGEEIVNLGGVVFAVLVLMATCTLWIENKSY